MPDREKVIKAIDICLGHGKCDDCGYRIKGGYSTMDCRKPMMRDALALLKEQEAVEPIITPWVENEDCEVVVAKRECGRCGYQFFTERPNFCENCGTQILWEGR